MRLMTLLALVLLLAACSSGTRQHPLLADFPAASGEISAEQRSLIYAYPAPGQTEVIPATPVVLRFSHPLAVLSASELASRISLLDVAMKQRVPMTLRILDGGRGLVLQPVEVLRENSLYQIAGSDVPLVTGSISLQAAGKPIEFRTRAASAGPAQAQTTGAGNTFTVLTQLPAPAVFPLSTLPGGFPLTDFSTLRLQFSQPLDAATAVYGSSVRLERGGSLVPARLLVSGNHMSIDPVDDLDPAMTYVLRLGDSIRSSTGQVLKPGSYAAGHVFTPRDTGSHSGQASRLKTVIPAGGLSLLTGEAINKVTVASPVLGLGALAPQTQAEGALYADLAYAPNFRDFNPAIVPMRIPRNSALSAASLSVKLGGMVPSGLDTGKLAIRLLSDANGLLLPNAYSTSLSAPSLVMLEMDIALSAEGATANGALTQNILHVAVSGIATIDQAAQKLHIEALAAIEMKVLGIDDGVGVLALKLDSDLGGAPDEAEPDRIAPVVQSWVPGPGLIKHGAAITGGELVLPGDPIIVTFSEPMEADSFAGADTLRLLRNGQREAFAWRVDGASLVITPRQPLASGADYALTLTTSIADLAGNTLASPAELTFRLPALLGAAADMRPPVVLSFSPGFPCAIEPGTRNVAANVQGRCAGGQVSDDLLPLPAMDPRRDIAINFSQAINPDSVRLGLSCNVAASFRVERVDAAGNCLGAVPGRLRLKPRELFFQPDEPWQKGQLYRYVLGSNNNLASETADCSGAQAICGSNGLPLQTQLIARDAGLVSNPRHGGPAMETFFTGGVPVSGTPVVLRLLPDADSDANFRSESGERKPVCEHVGEPSGRCVLANGAVLFPDNLSDRNGDGKPDPFYGGLASSFALGCPNGKDAGICEDKQTMMVTAALTGTVKDYDPQLGGVRVELDPAVIVTTGFTIYATLVIGGVDYPVESGPVVYRIRYDSNHPPTALIKAGPDGPTLSGTLRVYADAPEMHANAYVIFPIPISHNLRSYAFDLPLSGSVQFLPDGRMAAALSNTATVILDGQLSTPLGLGGDLHARVPPGYFKMDTVLVPVKK